MNIFEETIIATSSIAAGAVNKSVDGSTFDIVLSQSMHFPDNLLNCTIQVDEATVWWTIPNISPELGNDQFYVIYATNPYTITIPKGLYSLVDLQIAIDRELTTATGVPGLITLESDNATQRTSLTINQADTQVDFTPGDTFRDLLGFNSQVIPPAPPAGPLTQLSDNIAAFNTIDYFLLHCDLVDQGIRTNDSYSQTIYQVLIDVAPGSQIVSREFNPPKSNALTLSGQTVDRIKFWLTDQADNLVDTNGEEFSCRMVIKYSISND